MDKQPITRKLLIIRHAKSDWPDGMDDFDRPLSKKGHRHAEEMAAKIYTKGISLQLIYTSTANRSLTTAHYFQFYLKKKTIQVDIIKERVLYQSNIESIYNVISTIDDKINNVAIVGHNPSVTDFVNEIIPQKIIEMPTCGVIAIQLNLAKWKDFRESKKEILFFEEPS